MIVLCKFFHRTVHVLHGHVHKQRSVDPHSLFTKFIQLYNSYTFDIQTFIRPSHHTTDKNHAHNTNIIRTYNYYFTHIFIHNATRANRHIHDNYTIDKHTEKHHHSIAPSADRSTTLTTTTVSLYIYVRA